MFPFLVVVNKIPEAYMSFKKLLLLVIVMIIICVFPITALANSTPPGSFSHELLIDGCEDVETMIITYFHEDGSITAAKYESMETTVWFLETSREGQRVTELEGGSSKSIQIEVTLTDGSVQQSNVMQFSDYANYIYDVNENIIRRSYTYFMWTSGGVLFSWIVGAVYACALTLIIECLVSLIFRLKPTKYVCYVNLISNLSMNTLLFLVMSFFRFPIVWIVIVLEILVVAAEYLVYIRIYDVGKLRLLLFSLTANALSFGVYLLF